MFRLIKGFFSLIWRLITWIRVAIFNVIFLLLLALFVVGVYNSPKLKKANQSVLFLAPSGLLVDQLTYNPSPLDIISDGRNQSPETLVRELTRAIRQAANDDQITGLVLKLDNLQGGGISKLEEVGQAINEFRQSEKPVIAYGDDFSQQQYYLASYADQIYLNPLGSIALTGYGVYRNYMKEATEKLSLEFNVFRVGEFKDAIEPFLRNDMSPSSRQHTQDWVNSLWKQYTDKVETNRDLNPGAVQSFIDNMHLNLKQAGANTANLAISAQLVDELVSKVDLRDRLISRFGTDNKGKNLNAISINDYQRANFTAGLPLQKNVGLIVATGTILDGHRGNGEIGSDSLSKLLRKAGDDASLKALILRIDSGGGSAFASEIIREEVIKLREKNIPVYVSMGSVAASGGYWISAGAQEIWASPTTLTGSIGVWGLMPNASESFKRLGIHSDGVGTSKLADSFQINRPMPEETKLIVQSSVDNIYSKFLELVADAREQSIEDIHRIAQGRIWTGSKAHELGLVDRLGSLDDLVSYVSEKHDVEKKALKVIRRELDFDEKLLRTLTQEGASLVSAIQADWLDQNGLGTLFEPTASQISNENGGKSWFMALLKQKSLTPIYMSTCFTCEAI